MLQSLLQPRDNQRSKMIGAMPAVAVRHERRRNDKRGGGGGRRPSQLPLQLGQPSHGDPTPSPDHRRSFEVYFCGRVAALHAVVGSLLLGVVVLVVGLVQLSPGAEAAQHRFYLMGVGGVLVAAGVVGAILRCFCIHWYNQKYREEVEEEEEREHAPAHNNGVSTVESGHSHSHSHGHSHDNRPDHKRDQTHDHKNENDKPKLKAQPSMGIDAEPSATSDT